MQCPVCLEEIVQSEAVELGCGHRLCCPCLRAYLESRMQANKVRLEDLVCPVPACRAELPEKVIHDAFCDSYDKLVRLQDARARACALEGTTRSRPAQCPTPGCAVILVPAGAGHVTCPHCRNQFCSRCGHEAHLPLTCEAFRMQLNDIVAYDGISQCPLCREGFEYAGGCKFLRCARCHIYFCHLCSVQLTKDEHYTHYQGFPGAKGPFGNVCKNKQALSPRAPRATRSATASPSSFKDGEVGFGVEARRDLRSPYLKHPAPPAVALPRVPQHAQAEYVAPRVPPYVPPLKLHLMGRQNGAPIPPPAPTCTRGRHGWYILWEPCLCEPPATGAHVELRCLELELLAVFEFPYGHLWETFVPWDIGWGIANADSVWQVRMKFKNALGWGQLGEPVTLPPARPALPRRFGPQRPLSAPPLQRTGSGKRGEVMPDRVPPPSLGRPQVRGDARGFAPPSRDRPQSNPVRSFQGHLHGDRAPSPLYNHDLPRARRDRHDCKGRPPTLPPKPLR